MAKTKFEAVTQEAGAGKPNIIHEIDQFTWYKDGAPKKWDRWDKGYKKLPLSAIKFILPGCDRTELIVVSDSAYRLGIYIDSDLRPVSGRTLELCSVKLGEPMEAYYAVGPPNDKKEKIDIDTLFTTELSPFLMGGIPLQSKIQHYPGDCFRTYRMLLGYPSYVDAIADVRDADSERGNQTFSINLMRDGKSKPLLVLKRSDNWIPENLEGKLAKGQTTLEVPANP
jgi:hypothetical protein